ncbi:Uncharacterised protein [Enterobacter cloacae]|nr:Uncharacterised protein [Enterobacter cloacae]
MSTPQPCGTRKITFSSLRRISSMISSPFQSTRSTIFSGPFSASSAIIAMAWGAVVYMSSMIASRSASLLSGKQYNRFICARRRALLPKRPARRPTLPSTGSRREAGSNAMPANAYTPSQAPQLRGWRKDFSNSGMYSILFFLVSMRVPGSGDAKIYSDSVARLPPAHKRKSRRILTPAF